MGFPGGSVVKNLPANAGDVGLIPGLGRSPVKGNGKLLQYSCLGNPMDRGDLVDYGVTKELDTLNSSNHDILIFSSYPFSNLFNFILCIFVNPQWLSG